MRCNHPTLLLSISLAAASIVGCGDSDPATVAGGSASGAAGAKAVDPGKPASADQLVGTWFRNTDELTADPLGLEFSADGKLTLVGRPTGRRAANEITLDYAKLDNGRLRLSAPGNGMVTQSIQCNLNGDTLTVTAETDSLQLDFQGGTFTKLPAGKTIVARFGERIEEIEKERQAMAEKVKAMLDAPNLAIVPADNSGASSQRVALDVKPERGMWVGSAMMTVGNQTIQRQAQLTIAPADPRTGAAVTVVCTLGAVTGPDGAKPMSQAQSTFLAKPGADGKLALRDDLNRQLRADPDVGAKLAADYAAGVKKQRDLLDAFHAKLGALILAEDRPTNPKQTVRRIALLRVPDKDEYRLADFRGSHVMLQPAAFNKPFAVLLQDDEPLLVEAGSRRILAINGEGDARTFEGAVNGSPARFHLTRSMTADELKQHQARVAAFLDAMKTAPLPLVGEFFESYTYDNGKVRPIRISLGCPDGKTLAGTLRAEPFDVEFPIAGQATPTLLGVTMQFEPAGSFEKPIPNFSESYPGQLVVELDDSGKPTVSGKYQRGDGANRLDLTRADDAARVAALRKQLDAALAAGKTFKWARTGSTGMGSDVMTLTLKSDGGDNLTGTAGFRRDKTAPISGSIATDNGHLVIDLDVAPNPPDTVAAGKMRLWVVNYGDTFYLSGRRNWANENPPHPNYFVCYGLAE